MAEGHCSFSSSSSSSSSSSLSLSLSLSISTLPSLYPFSFSPSQNFPPCSCFSQSSLASTYLSTTHSSLGCWKSISLHRWHGNWINQQLAGTTTELRKAIDMVIRSEICISFEQSFFFFVLCLIRRRKESMSVFSVNASKLWALLFLYCFQRVSTRLEDQVKSGLRCTQPCRWAAVNRQLCVLPWDLYCFALHRVRACVRARACVCVCVCLCSWLSVFVLCTCLSISTNFSSRVHFCRFKPCTFLGEGLHGIEPAAPESCHITSGLVSLTISTLRCYLCLKVFCFLHSSCPCHPGLPVQTPSAWRDSYGSHPAWLPAGRKAPTVRTHWNRIRLTSKS